MPLQFAKAQRLQQLPPYLFAEIDKKKKAAIAAGKDVINLGVGDPDTPTPQPIIQSLQKNAEVPAFHQYALDQGAPELRASIASFCKQRYGLDLDAGSEILPLIGSKEGLAHFPFAVINPGDVALVPDPCYPVYKSSTNFAGGEVHLMPLKVENGFRPDFSAIPDDVWKRAKLMFLNYPNNPTGATVDLAFYEEVLDLAKKHNLIIAQDAAYNEMYYDAPPPSMLEIEGAKDYVVEFHSLSKTFNMTGWRVGFAIGSAPLVGALGQVKANMDSGIFTAIQHAAKTALDGYDTITPPLREMYKERRDKFVAALKNIGWDATPPSATFYMWIPCPKGYTSTETCAKLLDEAAVVTTPGLGFGKSAEGYIRATLTVPTERLVEAVERIGKLSW